MKYITLPELSKRSGVPETTLRLYCRKGKLKGAINDGYYWKVPEDAEIPRRNKKSITLRDILYSEKKRCVSGGIYHKIQIALTYNSNHIEGSRLTEDQTRYIYETKTILPSEGTTVRVDDIIETVNHFRCVDIAIINANETLTESFIKRLHRTLKENTYDSHSKWFAVGDYKRHPNEVGGEETTHPKNVAKELGALIAEYETIESKTLEDILDFHVRFEKIHPFQDGNGRVGRLIMFKECLRHNIVPFIIDESIKIPYYNGLKNWNKERGYLKATCELAQDAFKQTLDYFEIKY